MELWLLSLPQFSNSCCLLIVYQRILKIITEIAVVLKAHVFPACYKLCFLMPLVFMCGKLDVVKGKLYWYPVPRVQWDQSLVNWPKLKVVVLLVSQVQIKKQLSFG